jgi:predicted TIM-barrel fold metal-dependent hydrolase
LDQPDYPIFDADHHLYESPEVVTKYLPKKYAGEIQFVEVRGRTKIAIKGQICNYMPNPTFDRVAAPGCHVPYYAGENPDGKTLRELTGDPIDCRPEFREPGPRLERFDELGVNRALMFPTLANLMEYSLEGDPDLTHAAVHAVNEYVHDTWSFDYKNRIYSVPVITLPIVEKAIEELEWVLERGARSILIRPGPVTGYHGSRSFGLPEFDPFWARVEEAGIPVCMHASFPPLSHYYETWEPGRDVSAFEPTPLKRMLLGHREIEDAIAAMICQGTLSRFPKLRLMSVENGASWVGHLLDELELVYRQLPQDFAEDPVEVFRRNVYVNPFWEDDVMKLAGRVGSDHVLFGSDYPHPEGLAEPLDFFDHMNKAGVDPAIQRKVMSSNAEALFGPAAV